MEGCRLDLASWADVLLADAKLSVVIFIYILSTEIQVSILYSSTITLLFFFFNFQQLRFKTFFSPMVLTHT